MNTPDSWQPLGQALLDFHCGAYASTIIVRSSAENDRDLSVDVFYKKALRFSRLEQKALKFCKGSVLDIGAGAGAHSLWLQNKGLNVHAIDISDKAVQVMAERGVKQAGAADFFSFVSAEKYDTLLLMMNGIGICRTLEGLNVFLEQCRTMLSPGGQVIFDSTDISYVSDATRALAKLKAPENGYYGTVRYELIYKGKESPPYDWLFVDKDTIRKAAWQHGFDFKIIAEKEEQYAAALTMF